MEPVDVEQLIGSVIRGALGGKRKKTRGVTRFLTGGTSSFLNASTLLAIGGVAWGLYETMTQAPAAPPGSSPSAPRPVASGPVVPPPLPGASRPVVPPPLPLPSVAPAAGVSPEVLRVLRLTLSAARADGVLGDHERHAILTQARAAGADALVGAEIDAPTSLAEIAAGVSDARVREDLYTLAFSIVRADEQVLDGERQYLDELARHLGLDAAAVARLEQQAAERISQASNSASST